MNKLLLGVFHLQHLGILGLSAAWLYNFSYHPNAESNNCFIIHPKYLHLHQKILTGLDLSQVPIFMTDLVLGSSEDTVKFNSFVAKQGNKIHQYFFQLICFSRLSLRLNSRQRNNSHPKFPRQTPQRYHMHLEHKSSTWTLHFTFLPRL